MLKILTTLTLLASVASTGVWPDGSPMDSWFSKTKLEIPAAEKKTFVITDFGAVADSTLLQTEVIQKTIDAAAESGGTVVIPKGVWLTGSLFFKPHTHLRIDKGAVLKGSNEAFDFDVAQVHIEGKIQPYIAAIVNAYGVDGFSITGKGTIDGNGLRYWKEFWKRREVNRKCTNLEALRPRIIYVANSSDIHIEGVTLKDSPFWTTHLYDCSRVVIKDVGIFAPRRPIKSPSSDAIDVDGCNDVHITGCRISTNDDFVALKGGKGPWADTDPDNKTNARILVEDCWFGEGPGPITFGSECVAARNVIVRNCVVDNSSHILLLKMRPDTPQNYEYILIENITGTVRKFFEVSSWTQFFDLQGREDIPMSYARHITMRGCKLSCSVFYEATEQPDQYLLEDINLDGNEITLVK